jgi:squalene synthase HpnC
MPVDHYENFPVASILLPRPLRRPVELVYRFAREADDFADEGDLSDAERLEKLRAYDEDLVRIASGRSPHTPWFPELAALIRERQLPVPLFRDLLSAFSQDVVKKRYDSYPELLDYCRRSANPVGRLLLHLYSAASDENLQRADAICSSLQLINFWQDVAIDWKKNRIYIPQDDMLRFGVSERTLATGDSTAPWRSLMEFQINRTRTLMASGEALGRALRGRIGLELRMIIAGGNRILDKIELVRGDVLRHRPVLRRSDWLRMLAKALLP